MSKPTSATTSRVAKALADLPEQVRTVVAAASAQDRAFDPTELAAWRDGQGWSVKDAMLALLPLAAASAHAPISQFNVGAVAACTRGGSQDEVFLYLGANLEFQGGTLSDSVHAEQAAVVRAWLDGASALTAIATSAAPCGHCRQFLTEVRSAHGVVLFTPDGEGGLSDMLPEAFAPEALGSRVRLFDHSLTDATKEPRDEENLLATQALAAARQSYTPYSGCPSGAALHLASGRVVEGRALESVAFNPSLSPMQCALAQVGHPTLTSDPVVAALLAEGPGGVSHASRDARLLQLVAPEVELQVMKLLQ